MNNGSVCADSDVIYDELSLMIDPPADESKVLPYATPEPRESGPIPLILLAIASAHPLLALASLYITWLAAWIVLGHPPRPSQDDPKRIGAVVSFLHLITWNLFFTIPLGIFMGIYLGSRILPQWRPRRGTITRSIMFISALLCLYAGAYALLMLDPGRVMYWFMD